MKPQTNGNFQGNYPRPLAAPKAALVSFQDKAQAQAKPEWHTKRAAVLKRYPQAVCEATEHRGTSMAYRVHDPRNNTGKSLAWATSERNAWKAAFEVVTQEAAQRRAQPKTVLTTVEATPVVAS